MVHASRRALRGRIVTGPIPPRHQKTCLNEHAFERLCLSFIQNSATLKGMRLCPCYQILDVFMVPVLKTVMLFLWPHRSLVLSRIVFSYADPSSGTWRGKCILGERDLDGRTRTNWFQRAWRMLTGVLYQSKAQQLALLNIVRNFHKIYEFVDMLGG